MTDSPDNLLPSVISRVKAKVGKAEEAHQLSKELYYSLSANYARIFQRATQKQQASTMDLVEEGDVIVVTGERSIFSVMVMANLDGSQTFSTLAVLSFVDSTKSFPCTAYVIPKVGPFRTTGEKVMGFSQRVEDFLRRRKIDFAILLRDGQLYFDGFYVTVSDETQRAFAKRVVAAVAANGHQTGRYSLREDNPTYDVIRSDDAIFDAFAEFRIPAIGFTGSEDFQALVDALSFAFSDLTSS